MDWIVVIAVAIALVVILAGKLKATKRSKSAPPPNYRKHARLLSPAERSFYGVLKQAVGDTYEAHSKVRVADVLSPAKGLVRSAWQKSFNRISSKHFDFVLCSPDTLAIEMVIELNDKSHKQPQRAARDTFLEQACDSANLQLRFFAAKRTYSVSEIRESLTNDFTAP